MNEFVCSCDSGLPHNYDYGCAIGACDYCRESDKCVNCIYLKSYGKEDSKCNNCCYKDDYLYLKVKSEPSNSEETSLFNEDPF